MFIKSINLFLKVIINNTSHKDLIQYVLILNMKILCVVQRYYPIIGGSEILAKNFIDYLSKKHQVTVYTTNLDSIQGLWNKNIPKVKWTEFKNYTIKRYDVLTPKEIKFGKDVETFPLVTNHPGPFIPQLWQDIVFNTINFDLIYATAFPYDHILPAYIAAKKHKIPIIIAPLIHREFPHLYLSGMKLSILDNSDAIVAMTYSEKSLLENIGINSEKIFIIPPGFNHNPPPTQNNFKKLHSIPLDKKIVLFVGLKSEMKGIIFLIESMKHVWKNSPNTILLVIGPRTRTFDKYILNQNTETKKRIINLDSVNENQKQMAYEICDVFVLPSKSESFGIVYLEAWAYRKPVIGCKIPSTIEIIDNEKNGLLVEFGNKNQLSSALIKLLNNDKLAKQYGQKGKEKLSKFSLLNSCQKFEELCTSVIYNFNKKD